MINLQLMTMAEYKPVHRQSVYMFLANRQWVPLVNLGMTSATCLIHYQQYDPTDHRADSCWTSDTPENMEKIPFDTPFVHITEPFSDGKDHNGCERIIGFRLLEETELEQIADAASYWRMLCQCRNWKEKEDMTKADAVDWTDALKECEEAYEPYKDLPVSYHKKEWLFRVNSNHQIPQNDPSNEVTGIVDSDYLSNQFKDLI